MVDPTTTGDAPRPPAAQEHEPPAPVLELDAITKSFGSNEVLKGVTLTLRPGRVTALLGANGAGKSTLIKVLSGVYPDHGGEVRVDGEAVAMESPSHAARHGIQTVHQRIDENIVPGLTVAENLVFEEVVRGEVPKVSSLRRLMPRARQIAATLDLDWPDAVLTKDVFELGIADSQLLLLARALVQRPKVLVLDEPTSTLSASEVDRLFALVRRLCGDGVAVLYVTHRLSEVAELADDLVVLRDGRIRASQERPFDMEAVVRSMLGEGLATQHDLVEQRGSTTAITLHGVRLLRRSDPVDLELRYGEVTGVVGLIGAGKSEMARGIFGADRLRAGTMTLDGEPYAPRHTSEAVRAGVYLVPEDRSAEAMLPGWSLTWTATLPFLRSVSRWSFLQRGKERSVGRTVLEDFGVVATDPDQPVDALSGGNQQKVVVGRWMHAGPRVLLLDEPFRGVDIGARGDISRRAREQAAAGACVVVFSSDVEEIREIADRILVMVEGHLRLDAYTSTVDNDAIVTSMSEVA
ncbi:sugar ABC transporter ATP-binding protein [Actinotalea sp. M2MS4P-6]|uniref:sugar ABC transporter ATP-binding protein n=1 Tax=Actinotalea sp. M2MS4P-6 TaxID=2983762 RepID=UPI0021E3F5AD|nr:sugar ABC transporter ATP-binding protein [Actinotalea sp. M2MS4P-6]MCV2393059.1 sugar ABC transporter ATP-binding protein [Actinotalea sp. M2MS4P-6]